MPVLEKEVLGKLLRSRYRLPQNGQNSDFDDLLKKLDSIPATKKG